MKTILSFIFLIYTFIQANAQLSLDSLEIYYNQNEYTKVIKHVNQNVLDFSKINDTTGINYYYRSLNYLAKIRSNNGDYLFAEELLLERLDFSIKVHGEGSFQHAISLNSLGFLFFKQDKYLEAEPYWIEALNIRKTYFQDDTLDLAITLNNLGQLYRTQGRYIEAVKYFKEALDYYKIAEGKDSTRYDYARNQLAIIYEKLDKYYQAEKLYLECVEFSKIHYGKNRLEHAIALDNLGMLYLEMRRLKDSKPVIEEALKVFENTVGKESLDYAICLSNLAQLYFFKGDYSKSEELYKQTLNLKEIAKGKISVDYAITLNDLAKVYKKTNKPDQQERTLLKSLDIYKKVLEEKHPRYAAVLTELAYFYSNYGVYQKSEKYYSKACEVFKASYSENHFNYIHCIHQQARANIFRGEYEKSKKLYLEAISILNRTELNVLKENTELISTIFNNLAVVYQYQGKYEKSEKFFLDALKIKSFYNKKEDISYAVTLGSFSATLAELGKIEEAERMLLKSFEIIAKNGGKGSRYYNQALLNLAHEYILQENFEKANKYALESVDFYRKEIIEASKYLTTKELYSFKRELEGNRITPFLIFQYFKVKNDSLIQESFQNELLIKNLSLRNTNNIRESISESQNDRLIKVYNEFIKAKKTQNNYKLNQNEVNDDFVKLSNRIYKLEKEILSLSKEYSKNYNELFVNWKDVQSSIQNHEILLDFVVYDDGSEVNYGCFVVPHNLKSPNYLHLFNQKELNNILNYDNYRIETSINELYTDTFLGDLLLEKLKPFLSDVNTVYISPSGIAHKINFSAISINDSQNFGEMYNIHLLGSSSEIIDYEPKKLKDKSKTDIILYGDIDYDNIHEEPSTFQKSIKSNKSQFSNNLIGQINRSGINNWNYLPGTRLEIKQIKEKANFFGYNTNIKKGPVATKSSILNLDRKETPFILHIATHGFFFKDNQNTDIDIQQNEKPKSVILDKMSMESYVKSTEDPMLRSGLVFAGVNKYWGKTIENSGEDDGILTSKEISNLDLSSCELVILSACDSGLGDIKDSEGVFGLQRAFKMAGVKNIIVSLWKVPDAQTAELFDLFYEFCFKGYSFHKSLKLAQSEMQKKYSPYYWAGFVLLE